MNDIPRRADVGFNYNDGEGSRGESLGPTEEEEYVMPTMDRVDNTDVGTSSAEGEWNSSAAATTTGAVDRSMLQVYTIGQLMPRGAAHDGNNVGWSFDATGLVADGMVGDVGSGERQQQQDDTSSSVSQYSAPTFGSPRPEESIPSMPSTSTSQRGEVSSTSGGPSGSSSQRLRVRRSTLVSGWAVPPRVLLVDDDAVSRRLSSKFLEVFGCAIDVAVDGVGAVNKMNLEKYDLVLMVFIYLRLLGNVLLNLYRTS
jgi:osomolarity two-component system response regulator SKN7